jgi:hypothetical protein
MDHMQTETPFLKFWRRANEGRADRGAIFRTDRDSISLLRGLVQSQAYVCGHDADRYAANLHKIANRVSA